MTLGCHFLGNRQETGAAGLAGGEMTRVLVLLLAVGLARALERGKASGAGAVSKNAYWSHFLSPFKNIYIQKVKNRRIGEYVGEKRKYPKGVNGSCSVA